MFILPKRRKHAVAWGTTYENRRLGYWREGVVEKSAKDYPVISIENKTDESELNRLKGSSFDSVWSSGCRTHLVIWCLAPGWLRQVDSDLERECPRVAVVDVGTRQVSLHRNLGSWTNALHLNQPGLQCQSIIMWKWKKLFVYSSHWIYKIFSTLKL